jgi:hypothetical protein
MKRFIEGEDRQQVSLLPQCLDDYIGEDNPVRVVDAFVGELNLQALGFKGADPAATGRPAGSIGFAVASLLDDVAGFEVDGESVSPLLTFLTGENTLEFCGGNSYMHEYVHRLLPGLFQSKS